MSSSKSRYTLPKAELLQRGMTEAWAAVTTSTTNKQLSRAAQAAQGRAGHRHRRQMWELPSAWGQTSFLLKATGLQHTPRGHPARDLSSGWQSNAPTCRGQRAAAVSRTAQPVPGSGHVGSASCWAAPRGHSPPVSSAPDGVRHSPPTHTSVSD